MNKRPAYKINGFKYPAADKLESRISTIRRSMACTLLKRDKYDPAKDQKWMEIFPNKTCAYCGRPATHLDHLHALITEKGPSGYGTEPANLVPCCAACNGAKGNSNWEDFMESNKCGHTSGQGETEQQAKEERINNLKKFEKEMKPQRITIDEEIKERWEELLKTFEKMLKDAQTELLKMKEEIYSKHK